jgi:hypothetical protein
MAGTQEPAEEMPSAGSCEASPHLGERMPRATIGSERGRPRRRARGHAATNSALVRVAAGKQRYLMAKRNQRAPFRRIISTARFPRVERSAQLRPCAAGTNRGVPA